jgi:hypothetical protein
MAKPPQTLHQLCDPLSLIHSSLVSEELLNYITHISHRLVHLRNSFQVTIAHNEDPEYQAWGANILNIFREVEEIGVVGWVRWLDAVEREGWYERVHERYVAAQETDSGVAENEIIGERAAGLQNLQARCESADENGEEKSKVKPVEETFGNEKQVEEKDENSFQGLERRIESLQAGLEVGYGLSKVEADALRALGLRALPSTYEEEHENRDSLNTERGSTYRTVFSSHRSGFKSNGAQRYGDSDAYSGRVSTSEHERSRGKSPSMIAEAESSISHHHARPHVSSLTVSNTRDTEYPPQLIASTTCRMQINDRDEYDFEGNALFQEQEDRSQDLGSDYRSLFQDLELKHAQRHSEPPKCWIFKLDPPFTIPSHDENSCTITFRTPALALHFPGGATRDQLLETLKWMQEKGPIVPEVREGETLNVIRIRTQGMEWELKNAIVGYSQGLDHLRKIITERWPGEGRGDTYIVSAPDIHFHGIYKENSKEEIKEAVEDGWCERPHVRGGASIDESDTHKEDCVTPLQDGSDLYFSFPDLVQQKVPVPYVSTEPPKTLEGMHTEYLATYLPTPAHKENLSWMHEVHTLQRKVNSLQYEYESLKCAYLEAQCKNREWLSRERNPCTNLEQNDRRSAYEEPSTYDVSATGFYFFPSVSTVVLLTSPKIYFEWPRHTTLHQLRQILLNRKEAGIENDPNSIRIREILETRDAMGIPDPDMSDGRMVLINLPETSNDSGNVDPPTLKRRKKEEDIPFWEKKMWDETGEHPNWHETHHYVEERIRRREMRGVDRSHLFPPNNEGGYFDIGNVIRDLDAHPDDQSSILAGSSDNEPYIRRAPTRDPNNHPYALRIASLRDGASRVDLPFPQMELNLLPQLSELPDLTNEDTWEVIYPSKHEPGSDLDKDANFDHEQPPDGTRAAPCSPIDGQIFKFHRGSEAQIEFKSTDYSVDDELRNGKSEGCETWSEGLDPVRITCTFCESPRKEEYNQTETLNAKPTIHNKGTYSSSTPIPGPQNSNIRYKSDEAAEEDDTQAPTMPCLRGGGGCSTPTNAGARKRVRFYDLSFLPMPLPSLMGSYRDPLASKRSDTNISIDPKTRPTFEPIGDDVQLIDFNNRAYKVDDAPPSPHPSVVDHDRARNNNHGHPAPLQAKSWQGLNLTSPYSVINVTANTSTDSLDTQPCMALKEQLIQRGIYRPKDLRQVGIHNHDAEKGLCGTGDGYTLPAEGDAVWRAISEAGKAAIRAKTRAERSTEIETSFGGDTEWTKDTGRKLEHIGQRREEKIGRGMRSQKGKDKWVPTTEAGPSNPRVGTSL